MIGLKLTMGADFGSLSVRVIVADVENGREAASAVSAYPHGVMTRLPDGTPLPPEYALQHPADYLECLREAAHACMKGIDPADVIGFALDFTADTSLPVDEAGQPLCLKPEYASCPQAWVKMWKHHGAEKEAKAIREAALRFDPALLEPYGGQVSSEWMLPKLLETCHQAPQLMRAADRFLQAGDWVIGRLTGSKARSASHAGYKNFRRNGAYPPDAFLAALHPLMIEFTRLMAGEPLIPGSKAGELSAEGAAMLGLREGTPVAVSGTDAFHPMPALGLTDAGDLLMSIGTSTCHTLLSRAYRPFKGIGGVVEDGIIPGLYGYESGQTCTGDLFDWAARQWFPASYAEEAARRGITAHDLLTEKASALKPGQNGLLALDWWNGSRSPFMNFDLTGLILGMTLDTKPEEMYRALIEANAFGTRLILDGYAEHGIAVERVFACGGITRKNPMLMQTFADILGRDLRVADSSQTAALGSAIFAAVAAGAYGTVKEAADRMKCGASTVYAPNAASRKVYDRLYREYLKLTDLFSSGENDPMSGVRKVKNEL